MATHEWEPMLGYCMNEDGSYAEPDKLNSEDDMRKFLLSNVEKFYELRITDMMDNCTFHVVDRSLVFPIPQHGSKNNKWNPATKLFENV